MNAGAGTAPAFAGATLLLVALTALPLNTARAETQRYRYDVHGRLNSVVIEGGPNNGSQVNIQLDPASNRVRFQVATGNSGAGDCTLIAAPDSANNDEFSVYTYIERSGNCPSALSVDYSVVVAGSNTPYPNAAPFAGFGGNPATGPIQPSETNPARRWVRIWAGYGSVPAGNPLVLRVTWRLISGTATISRASSLVTFYNSECGC